MAALDDISGRRRAPDFYVAIAGVDTLFATREAPTVATDGTTILANYRKSVSVLPTGLDVDRQLDVARGVVDIGTLDVYLRTFEDTPLDGDATDPALIFGRMGPTGATAYGFLTETIKRDVVIAPGTPLTVDVDTDFSSLSFPRFVHIGAECFYVHSATSSTLTLLYRERLGTLPQSHIADTLSGSRPLITTEPVYFRGRRAIVYERAMYADGGASGWVERWRGDIDTEPEFSDDGTIRISIAPLTARLRAELGSTIKPTTLATGYHYWSGGVGTKVTHTQFALEGELYDESVSTGDVAGGATIQANTDTWSEVFATPGTLVTGHPRGGTIGHRSKAGGSNARPTEPTAIAGAAEFTVPTADPSEATAVGDRVFNVAVAEERTVEIVDTSSAAVLGKWPATLLEAINQDGSGWNPGTLAGYDGAWCDVTLHTSSQRGTHLRVTPNCVPDKLVRLYFRAAGGPYNVMWGNRATPESWSSDGPEPRVDYPQLLDPLALSYADPADEPDRLTRLYGNRSLSNQAVFGAEAQARRDGIVIARGIDREVAIGAAVESETEVPIHPLATAWYQRGERYILSAGPVLVPSGGEATIRIVQDGDEIGTAVIIAETAVTDGGVTVGYALELHADYYTDSALALPSFAQYQGSSPVEIRPSVSVQGRPLAEALREILVSGGGGEVTGAYDKLAIGGGLDMRIDNLNPPNLFGADIDTGSISAIPNPGSSLSFSVAWEDGDTLEDLVGGMLRVAGYALDISTDDTGKCRLRAVPLHIPAASNARATLTEADVAARPVPSTRTDDAIFNVYELKTGKGDDDSGGPKVKVENAASIAAFNEARKLEVDLPGLIIDATDIGALMEALRPLYSRLSSTLAWPRYLWRMRVRTGLSATVGLGTTVAVQIPRLRVAGGRLGVATGYGVVRAVRGSLWDAAVDVELLYFGGAAAGYGPSAEVESVVSSTIVQVVANKYTPEVHPITGAAWSDAHWFELLGASTQLRHMPRGNMAGVASLPTVVGVNTSTRRITFSGAHGMSAGDYIVPPVYASADSYLDDYAYLGRLTVA
jgi:hypothetical protein